MAFLDNSGDIILDAVLTDTGRKLLASGKFKVSKFALGDDEIDYGLYDLNHPSGSAYRDLTIMQTPIMEAGAPIRYGLVTRNNNQFYGCSVVVNTKQTLGLPNVSTWKGQTIILDTTNDTGNADGTGIEATLLAGGVPTAAMMTGDAVANTSYWLIESGIGDLTELTGLTGLPKGTQANSDAYIKKQKGTYDQSYSVEVASGIFGSVMGSVGGIFENNATNNGLNASFTLGNASPTTAGIQASTQTTTQKTQSYTVGSIPNKVYSTSGTDTQSTFSEVAIPGTVTAVSVNLAADLGTTTYSQMGTLSDTVAGKTVDTISTTIQIKGSATGDPVAIPVLVVRLP